MRAGELRRHSPHCTPEEYEVETQVPTKYVLDDSHRADKENDRSREPRTIRSPIAARYVLCNSQCNTAEYEAHCGARHHRRRFAYRPQGRECRRPQPARTNPPIMIVTAPAIRGRYSKNLTNLCRSSDATSDDLHAAATSPAFSSRLFSPQIGDLPSVMRAMTGVDLQQIVERDFTSLRMHSFS